jgi:hypothetical protein
MLRPTAQKPPPILSNDDTGTTIPSATARSKPTAIPQSSTTVRDLSNSTDARGHNRLVPQINEKESPDTQHSILLHADHASRSDGTDTTNASSRGDEQNVNISPHHQTRTDTHYLKFHTHPATHLYLFLFPSLVNIDIPLPLPFSFSVSFVGLYHGV